MVLLVLTACGTRVRGEQALPERADPVQTAATRPPVASDDGTTPPGGAEAQAPSASLVAPGGAAPSGDGPPRFRSDTGKAAATAAVSPGASGSSIPAPTTGATGRGGMG